MRLRGSPGSLVYAVAVAVVVAAVGCSGSGSGAPTREVAIAELRPVAEALKRDGEKVDPVLGVKSTWNIDSVEVQPQPNDPTKPWSGTIHFRIETRMRDADGTVTNDRLDKYFNYLYDAATKKWVFQYKPGR